MSTLLVHHGTLYTPFEAIEDGAVLARDGVIEYAGPRSEVVSRADVEIDAGGRLICPGFVDIQVNGGGGALLTEQPDRAAVEAMARAHARFGTTSLLPTVVTAPEEQMARALAAVREAVERSFPGMTGARVLGAHLEGPFLSQQRRGAHPERLVRAPDRALLDRLLDAAGGALRLITLAPELPGALDLIAAARAAGAAVSIGHSDATYEEALHGLDAGATAGTHLFNGMRPLGQREPGIIGALLRDARATPSLIADGVHVHPAVLALAYRAKGPEGIALVTDAMSPVGTDVASFPLGRATAVVRDGACFLEDGTLAGSVLSMNEAVRRMRDEAGVPLVDALRMATATPARVLGRSGEIGVLAPGARADVVVCDADLAVWKVFVGGEPVYEAAS
ncbi:MAG: N-acetylglucosamine-6-phosphate deacetylase [Chloroflexi bacterium]|nr:N-acetylglucosamine-6-phosphate deacetylase [Chloroflexota bacterium]